MVLKRSLIASKTILHLPQDSGICRGGSLLLQSDHSAPEAAP